MQGQRIRIQDTCRRRRTINHDIRAFPTYHPFPVIAGIEGFFVFHVSVHTFPLCRADQKFIVRRYNKHVFDFRGHCFLGRRRLLGRRRPFVIADIIRFRNGVFRFRSAYGVEFRLGSATCENNRQSKREKDFSQSHMKPLFNLSKSIYIYLQQKNDPDSPQGHLLQHSRTLFRFFIINSNC